MGILAALKRLFAPAPAFRDAQLGTESDISTYISRLVRSPADAGTLIIQVIDAEPFVQFTGGPSGLQMTFPLITAEQQGRESRIRRFFEARQIRVRSTFGSDGAQFIDVELNADSASVTQLVKEAFNEIFALTLPLRLQFMGEGWGVAA